MTQLPFPPPPPPRVCCYLLDSQRRMKQLPSCGPSLTKKLCSWTRWSSAARSKCRKLTYRGDSSWSLFFSSLPGRLRSIYWPFGSDWIYLGCEGGDVRFSCIQSRGKDCTFLQSDDAINWNKAAQLRLGSSPCQREMGSFFFPSSGLVKFLGLFSLVEGRSR